MLIDEILVHEEQMSGPGSLLAGALRHAVRFQVDNVASYVYEGGGEKKNERRPFRIEESIPNVAPLAGIMWFEYNGVAVGQPPSTRYGCLLTVDYDRKYEYRASKYEGVEMPPEVCWMLRAEYFVFQTTERTFSIMASDWVYYIGVGDEGQTLGMADLESSRVSSATPANYQPDEYERSVWHEEIIVALTAICFSHCKGVVVEPNKPTRQERRAAERTHKPVVTFHTINIYPATRVLREQGKIHENGLARALHICRGHFAHYTEEHPLFGKYAGTFYRPMHFRGSADQGLVVKDYQVHAPGTNTGENKG